MKNTTKNRVEQVARELYVRGLLADPEGIGTNMARFAESCVILGAYFVKALDAHFDRLDEHAGDVEAAKVTIADMLAAEPPASAQEG